jgi:hypothetical protein
MVGAVTEAYVRLRRQAALAEVAPGENPPTMRGWVSASFTSAFFSHGIA